MRRYWLISPFMFLSIHCVDSSSQPEVQVSSSPSSSLSEVKLVLPYALHASTYKRVRNNKDLADIIDNEMLPVLQTTDEPQDILSAFHKTRTKALQLIPDAPKSIPGKVSTATGPGPGPASMHNDFNRVCTDILHAWFVTRATGIAANQDPLPKGLQDLKSLENLARTAFPWNDERGASVAIDVMLKSAALQQK